MEHIRQAVERARGTGSLLPDSQQRRSSNWQFQRGFDGPNTFLEDARAVDLNPAHLDAQRVVAYDASAPHSKPYDMLRTQVLQSMDQKGWHFLAITSPTPECGKTLTAVNLAMSIARQPDRSVILLDLDLQRPKVSSLLGVPGKPGLLSVIEGRTALYDSLIRARIGANSLGVLSVDSPVPDSSQWLSSRAMGKLLQELRANFRSSVAIFDLPPLLHSDDVISVLPHMDCVLFVTAVGTTTVDDIKECNKYLQTTDVVRIVVNKVNEPSRFYYPGYGGSI